MTLLCHVNGYVLCTSFCVRRRIKSAGGHRWISCVVHGGMVVYRQTSISNDEMENKIDCHSLSFSRNIIKMRRCVCWCVKLPT